MKYLKIFEEFDRGHFTPLPIKQVAIIKDIVLEKYPYLNILDDYISKIEVSSNDYTFKGEYCGNFNDVLDFILKDINRLFIYFFYKDYTINNDLIDVNGDVSITNEKGLEKLPFKYGTVTGSFNCYSTDLVTLEGCPKKIGGNFICNENQLVTLTDVPEEINGNFACSRNMLTTLIDGPKKVGGNYICSHNKLTSLEGAPESVGGYFDCSFNSLTSLEYLPKKIGDKIYCTSKNTIKDLSHVPEDMIHKIKKYGYK